MANEKDSEHSILKMAEFESKRRSAEIEERRRYAHDYEQATIKGLFLANGAAIISLITLVGNSDIQVDKYALYWSFVWFSIGLVFAMFANILGAMSQDRMASAAHWTAIEAEARSVQLEYERRSKAHAKSGNSLFRASMASSFLALVLFVSGAMVALGAVT
ncbi:hypothetical protein [Pontixanthobacter sp. CEM42]|uniref:hypothetical protein n=1 Tax=Pontixanthobacter sp. CEM42 TaxID=2792077 RepID=UPI001AE0AEDE|nr:hypothetical protein [Pontixanthobacter sp. CEM42]